MRVAHGHIDRSKPVHFRFNGKTFTGFEGDTLASALVANGVHLVARSFRYHRPRGIFSAGVEENHALVSVGEGSSREPNVRATLQPLFEGLVATSQRGWPSANFDIGALLGWSTGFLPTAFYYKTFMWPSWGLYENLVRRSAGMAPAPAGPDPDRYDKQHAHCDLLIVGGGPAGLAAALAAAHSGLRIILADNQPALGGALWWCAAEISGQHCLAWAHAVARELNSLPNVTVLSGTTVHSAWDHGYFTAVQKRSGSRPGDTAQRLWKIRSRRTVLASGAIERPLVFPDNDRPGIMLADSARQYANRYGALPGRRAVVYTNNDSAYRAALDLQARGVDVDAVVDVRTRPADTAGASVRAAGIELYSGYELVGTRGCRHLRHATIRSIGAARRQAKQLRLACDLLCISGGWDPALHLYSQTGGRLRYDEALACFLANGEMGEGAPPIHPAGAANGQFDLAGCLSDGHRAGVEAAERLGARCVEAAVPTPSGPAWTYGIQPHWQAGPQGGGRQFVDHLHDVTVKSIKTAVREGFTSVEHLKRYTATGMSMDQGKTGNVNALGVLAESTGRTVNEVGTTTFRPPFHPVSLGALAGRETGSRAWPMRRLPLHDWHVKAGGRMEDHSGWYRAASYAQPGECEGAAIRREVLAARWAVSLFDSSSLGKIEVRGHDAARFLNRIYVNNVESLNPGRVRYGMMLNENGIIVDDGVFARLDDDFFLLSTSSAGKAEVLLALEEWLQTEWPDLDVLVHDATAQWATLTVIGPEAREVLGQVLPGVALEPTALPHMSVVSGDRQGVPYRLMRVSFTGELSFELNVPAAYALAAWTALLQAGEPHGIRPLGMEALDVLRTEKGFLEVGVDTDVTTSPLDVGWSAAIAKKPIDFIGRRSLARPENQRPDRLQLVGLKPRQAERFVPVGSQLLSRSGKTTEGHVTSSCISPALGYSIAMAMLSSGHSRLGGEVTIDVDGERLPANVVPLAFYDPEGTRIHS